MEQKLIQHLQELAQKYETADFIKKDPSQFMHRYSDPREMELAAFLSANLAFGRRDQILKHIQMILDDVEAKSRGSLYSWIMDKKYLDFFPSDSKSFYRMYTNSSMQIFFQKQREFLMEENTLGEYFKKQFELKLNLPAVSTSLDDPKTVVVESAVVELAVPELSRRVEPTPAFRAKNLIGISGQPLLAPIINSLFDGQCNLVSKTPSSCSKKMNMFLRWMVRDNSPVDLGLWKNWVQKKDLLIPLDTHVIQQALGFGLLESSSASIKSTILLTDKLRQAFPQDPAKGDFALFGLGVNS